ncbi:MAG: glycosyltransferase family 9 protein [Planctomycetota bacterium]|jgi:ADP-heptose:LPS heptosyltransferase
MSGRETPKRILIVRLSALGDTALTLPLAAALRKGIPDAKIGWVVGAGAAPLVEDFAAVDRVHVMRKGTSRVFETRRLAREVRAEGYDVSLDVQGLTKSAIIPALARVRRRIGFARAEVEGRELSTLLATELVRPPEECRHIVARQLRMGAALGPEMPEDFPIKLPVDSSALERMKEWRDANSPPRDGRPLVMGMGAGWPTKVIPSETLAALAAAADDREWRCVMVWGPAERKLLDHWREQFGRHVTLAPETSVREMVALLSLADRFAGPDSAALHIAALLGKPTFSWFGASDPARVAPRGDGPDASASDVGPAQGAGHEWVSRGLECQPCWKRKCASPNCVRLFSPDEILPSFTRWLGE